MGNEGVINAAKRPMTPWVERVGLVVALIIFLIGIWSVPLAIFGPDLALIPGDLGDSRFNNYILEHFHRFVTGKTDDYWNAPFMYPYANALALSDNLLGSAPIYSAFRALGLTREGAFQGWLLALFTLNYWCCLVALRKWAGNTVLAACAAYIFAFGIYNIGHMNNLQVLPRFIAPLALFFLWNHMRNGSWKWLLLAVLATAYQFYCGIYIGFILVYALFFLFLGHLIAYRRPSFLVRARDPRFVAVWLLTIAAGLLLLVPLMTPYMAVPKDIATRHYEEIAASIPRPVSYFFTHPAALSWRSLSHVGVDAFPLWWNHFHFVGALPWLAVLAVPFRLVSKSTCAEEKRLLMAITTTMVLSILFCMNLGGSSLYELVFQVPGFSVLRAIDRYINVLVLFFLILFVSVLRPLFQKRRTVWPLSLMLPVLAVQDNRWETSELNRFDKLEAKMMVQDVARRITREYSGPDRFDAIAYEPRMPAHTSFEERHGNVIHTQINVMLAAQELGIPVVNAYSGGYPGPFIKFFQHMDHRTLVDWCAFNGIGTERIQEIDGLDVDIAAHDTVRLLAANGRYLCADLTKGGVVLANKDKAHDPETFLQLQTNDGRVAFLSINSQFLCAELEQNQQLSATGKDLGDFGLFTMEALESDMVRIKAFNGQYLMLDRVTEELHATGTGTEPETRFKLLRLLRDDHAVPQ